MGVLGHELRWFLVTFRFSEMNESPSRDECDIYEYAIFFYPIYSRLNVKTCKNRRSRQKS